ncbi:MAG: SDR family oxidoreductase [Steroidobacteraceae bacterium]
MIAARRILLTGAAGGIGIAIARELSQRGAAVLLTGRDAARLQRLAGELGEHRDRIDARAADLATEAGRASLVDFASRWRGGVDALINNAGINDLALLDTQDAAQIDRMIDTNLRAPIHLCRALLPQLRHTNRADIINVGSVFGSIGYPGYAVYSATKFAMRGFTEALHRELAGSTVRAHYLAPRATRTRMNAGAADRLNAELGTAVDEPAVVAKAVCRMLEAPRPFAVLGWPEKLFARLNAVMPRLVDGALIKQLPAIRRHASSPHVAPTQDSSLQET